MKHGDGDHIQFFCMHFEMSIITDLPCTMSRQGSKVAGGQRSEMSIYIPMLIDFIIALELLDWSQGDFSSPELVIINV